MSHLIGRNISSVTMDTKDDVLNVPVVAFHARKFKPLAFYSVIVKIYIYVSGFEKRDLIAQIMILRYRRF